ncbi:MAG: MBL fold metallo-hydrolase [Spirulina sp. SIO3F2]|nr:MBL fold metallo-hydrolase [Spirulina sp. SIO3F2]
MPNTNVREESLTVSVDVQFWGVRDQIPTPGAQTVRYGGNTSCVEVRIGSQRLVFDGGTGLRTLGNSLLAQMPVEAHLFFTHCHWDRIQGFPFFVPAFIPINHFHIYGAKASNGSTFQQRLKQQMLGPNFPVPIQVMQSKLEFHELDDVHKTVLDDEVVVESAYLNVEHHSVGYRVTCGDKVVVYAMSPDCFADQPQQALIQLAQDANLLILAAPKQDRFQVPHAQEHPLMVEHWISCAAIAKEANVGQVLISLYSPEHSDDYLDKMEAKLKLSFPQAGFAREGMTVAIA